MPFQELLFEYREIGLVVAVLIGFGFGFVLERAGFGNAAKLAAQFYLYDMTVFKVMFSAIITAMAGLALASTVGLVDLKAVSESAASFTYLWPMLVAGLVLGVGFIVAGYCPGTSLVASASGNIDGMFAFAGVVIGSVVYGELYPLIATFHNSSDMGHLFLYNLFGIPAPVLAAGVVFMAIAMFFGAEKVERIFKHKAEKDENLVPASPNGRIFAFASVAGVALIALGMSFLVAKQAKAPVKQLGAMDQPTLARRVLDEPWQIRVLDLRKRDACVKQRIPGAECTPFDTVDKLGLQYTTGARDLVLVGSETLSHIPKTVHKYPGNVYVLRDGMKGWRRFALTKPDLPRPGVGPAVLSAYRFQASLHAAMTGIKAAPPPVATGVVAPRKKKKGGGCS